jgi:hypothetical protein
MKGTILSNGACARLTVMTRKITTTHKFPNGVRGDSRDLGLMPIDVGDVSG